jgi:hypothetical protein
MTRMAVDMSTAHEALLREREALTNLQARRGAARGRRGREGCGAGRCGGRWHGLRASVGARGPQRAP